MFILSSNRISLFYMNNSQNKDVISLRFSKVPNLFYVPEIYRICLTYIFFSVLLSQIKNVIIAYNIFTYTKHESNI